MTRNVTLSIVALVPLVGIGGVVGTSMSTSTPTARVELAPPVTLQPLEMHAATDVRKIPDQEIESLF